MRGRLTQGFIHGQHGQTAAAGPRPRCLRTRAAHAFIGCPPPCLSPYHQMPPLALGRCGTVPWYTRFMIFIPAPYNQLHCIGTGSASVPQCPPVSRSLPAVDHVLAASSGTRARCLEVRPASCSQSHALALCTLQEVGGPQPSRRV